MGEKLLSRINKDFLTQCLKVEYDKPSLVVTQFSAAPAVPPGSGYCGCIVRVGVEFVWSENFEKTNFISLIVKADLTEGTLNSDIFKDIESIFYFKFLPAANDIFRITAVPKHYPSPNPSIIILEDLKEKGFRQPDRLTQLDFDHCRLYMVAAATLHAVSVATLKNHPNLIESIGKEKMFVTKSNGEGFFKIFFKYGLKSMVEGMEKIGMSNNTCTFFKNNFEKIWGMLQDALKPSKLVNTVNQGDPWTNNMMFKYDDNGVVNEIKLFDFQLLKYGSLVSDLTFFIWSSANHDVRSNRLEELYHVYLDTFNNRLLELTDFEAVTYEDFKEEVKRFSPMALAVEVVMYPTRYYPAQVDLASFLKSKNGDANPYNVFLDTNYYDVYLPKAVEQMQSAGIIDYLQANSK